MKDEAYHVANFATFVTKTLTSPPPPPQKKMDEFNFRQAQYCIKKYLKYLGDFKMDVIKW